jgi:hypothetical protein
MRDRVAGFRGPLAAERFEGGQSNPTYKLAAATGTYILRRKPLGHLLPSAHAVDREYRVIYRAREICIGIVSADVVLAGTDFGGARLRFAPDSPLEEAVLSELVSEPKFPASWEYTGPSLGR